jgi:hypothetical protein
MKGLLFSIAGVYCLTTAASAANLNVWVHYKGSSMGEVTEGQLVQYQVFGELSDDLSQGLALAGFDLVLDCAPLPQADTPNAMPMNNFVYEEGVTTAGLNNPQGYGGTKLAGEDNILRQVGGAQNTIKNTALNAPYPTGTPILDVAQPGTPVMLVQGSFTAPDAPNTCHLNVMNLFANVITADADGVVYYKTEQAGVGEITNLTLTVLDIPSGVTLVSSSPACLGSLWRNQNNFVTLEFDGTAPAVAAGQVQINALDPDGAFGPDLSSQFTFASNGNSLRIQETGSVLTHRSWIAIRAVGGSHPGINDFRVNLVVQVGDADGNGRVNNGDANAVNGGIPCASCPDDRRDIDGNNRINNGDTNLVNGRVPSATLGIPGGHEGTCNP